MRDDNGIYTRTVNCRIGSLEIASRKPEAKEFVNCRIGSLETFGGRAVYVLPS